MIASNPMNAALQRSDAQLVTESLRGSREAFRQIVERYETLICSVAYSATGSLSQSQDIAQDTFVEAWTHLASLHEPQKLRSWLCGIVRHRVHRSRRSEHHEPACQAEAPETASVVPAAEALPSEQAISREEESILWRSLERIPELYREPLILFYRQHQSVAQVAVALDLSEDAIKQRLTRGRRLLQEEVRNFVEGALERSRPGAQFCSCVVAALPLAAAPMSGASLGWGAKSLGAKAGLLGSCLLPFIGIGAGILAQCLVIRSLTAERSLRWRRMGRVALFWILLAGSAWAGESLTHLLCRHFGWTGSNRFVALALFWVSYGLVLNTFIMLCWPHSSRDSASGPVAFGLKPLALAGVVAGTHLALFSWLVRLAWIHHDPAGAVTIGVLVFGLALTAYWRIRHKAGLELERVYVGHFRLCAGVLLLAGNLRLDVWAANAYQMSVPEIHQLLPLWLVPVLSAVWTLWIVGLSWWKEGARLQPPAQM